MPAPWSRQAPWPWDMLIGRDGIRLVPDQNGQRLHTSRPRPLDDTVPTDYDYGSYAPYRERAFVYRWLFGGAGQPVQQPGRPTRYDHAINADLSLGYRMKGPFFHLATPDNTGSVTGFVEGVGSDGNVHLMATCGRYVNQLNADETWTMVKDMGVGSTIPQAVRFKDGSASPVDAMYFGLVTSGAVQRFWQWVGATNTWTQAPYPAANFTVLREELWKGWNNFVAKCTSDPMTGTDPGTGVGGDWAGAIPVGDASTQVNWLAETNNQLFIFKENKIYSVDTTPSPNLDKDLFPGLITSPSKTNGLGTATFASALWAPFGGSLQRLVLGTFGREEIQAVGPERYVHNTSEVTGYVGASAGHNDWFLYSGINNPLNGNSYLAKMGSWVPPELSGQADVVFTNPWHFALKKWEDKLVTAMAISSYNASNDRLWIGFSNGTVEWAWLPRNTPNPTLDPNCEFNSEDAYTQWSTHHANLQSEYKNFRGFSVFGPKIDAANRVWMEYSGEVNSALGQLLDGTLYSQLDVLTYAQIEALTGNEQAQITDQFTYNGQRLNMPTNVVGKQIVVREHLVNDSITATPIVEGAALHEQLRPDFVLEYAGAADANAPVVKLDGSQDRRSSEQIRDLVRNVTAMPGTIRCLMPDGSVEDLSFVDYPDEQMMAWDKSYGSGYVVPFKAVQFISTAPKNGTYGRLETGLTYEDLESLTYTEMEIY